MVMLSHEALTVLSPHNMAPITVGMTSFELGSWSCPTAGA